MKIEVYCKAIPNIPWEEPIGEAGPVWRYSGNPGGVLCDGETGRIAVYYGCADICTSIAFTTIDRVIPYIQENSL